MKHLFFKIFLLLSPYFLHQPLTAQKHFNLTVKLPKGVNPQSIEAWLDNGKGVKKIKPQSTALSQLVFTGTYYSLYASINLQNTPEEQAMAFAQTFFVQEKPATIIIHATGSPTDASKNYAMLNAFDFKEDKNQLDDYTTAELHKASRYEQQYGEKIFSGNDTVIRNEYFKVLMPALRKKKLEFIVNHPKSYYFFYIFRTELAVTRVFSADSLFRVFMSFPKMFKYSDEGNYLNALLHGRLLGQKADAIGFTVKDIHKNTISLSQFKGKKYVLLHFWATWCSPCMQELPALKAISNQYCSKDLQIISIALPSSKYADFLKTINKFQMNWIHVYDHSDLINKYGNAPTPRLCLIDKTGNLVYDNVGIEKNDNLQLLELNQKLMEVIHE